MKLFLFNENHEMNLKFMVRPAFHMLRKSESSSTGSDKANIQEHWWRNPEKKKKNSIQISKQLETI